jgi:hypothetical protein
MQLLRHSEEHPQLLNLHGVILTEQAIMQHPIGIGRGVIAGGIVKWISMEEDP